MSDSLFKGNSTFDVARQVVSWAREVDPDIRIQEDDVMPLCVGPTRKVLSFSMSNFRNNDDISRAVKRRELMNRKLRVQEREKIHEGKSEIHNKIFDSQKEQRKLRNLLNQSIKRMRRAEGKKISLRDDYDAFQTRERVIQELGEKREKELDLWSRTIHEVNDISEIETVEMLILGLQKRCIDALNTLNENIIQSKEKRLKEVSSLSLHNKTAGDAKKHQQSGSELIIPQGVLTRKETEAELHAGVITDYLSAAKMSHSATEKLKEKIIVLEENKEVFKNALAVELSLVEKSILKKIIAEAEISVKEMSGAPAELKHQQMDLKSLKEKISLLKKKITNQAKSNISSDIKLSKLIDSFYNEKLNPSVCFDDSSIDFIGKDERSGIEESEDGLSVGDRLDADIKELGLVLFELNGCWSKQSQALSETTVNSLRRIVPDTVAVTYNKGNNVNNNNKTTSRNNSFGTSLFQDSSLLDSLVENVDSAFQLPLPIEDFSTRQASNPTSTFRLLASRLGVSSSLSASATLQSISAIQKRIPIAAYKVDDSLIDSLNSATDRLAQCLSDSQGLRKSLHSLIGEEKIINMALQDFNNQGALSFN